MENAEVYFRLSAQVRERELFLEKAMLESDVHDLEVRSGFYDKLALLLAGSLAVGVSFLVSGYQNTDLKCGVKQYLLYLGIAMISILFSLILCVIHNATISYAVSLLSKQVEFTYHAANVHAQTTKLDNSYNEILKPSPEIQSRMREYEEKATVQGTRKDCAVKVAKCLGWATMGLFILGYAIGVIFVFVILYRS
jgi:hypothetical protein